MSKTFNQVKLNVNFTAISPSSNMSNIASDDNISETLAKIHHWYVKTNGFQASSSPLVSTSNDGIVTTLPSTTGGFLKNTGTAGGVWTTLGDADIPNTIVRKTGNNTLSGLFKPTSNNGANLGSDTYRFQNIYGTHLFGSDFNGFTIEKSVPSDAVFTDHIATATTTGAGVGKAVTSISDDGAGNITATTGSFLPSTTTYAGSDTVGGSASKAKSLIVNYATSPNQIIDTADFEVGLGINSTTMNESFIIRFKDTNEAITSSAISLLTIDNDRQDLILTTMKNDGTTIFQKTFLSEHPSITKQTDTTSTASPAHGETFTAIDSVTRDTNGHVTKINTKTVTLPAAPQGYTHPTYTARTGKPMTNQTPSFGETFTISQITSDTTGHVTAATDRTVKIPSLPTASTSVAGIVQLSSSTTSSSTTLAATPSAVKAVKDALSGYIPTSGYNNITGNLEMSKATGSTGYYANRSDTGTRVYFGVGSGGTAHGIYSHTLGNWVFKHDGGTTTIPMPSGGSINIGGITVPSSSGSFLATGNTSFSSSLTSGTKIGTITIGGTATDLYCQTNTDTKVTNTVGTANTYYPTGLTATATTTGTQVFDTSLKFIGTTGSTSAVGKAQLVLGNATASGTANNKQGSIVVYGSTAYAHTIQGAPTAARTLTLPNATGTLALTSDLSSYIPLSGSSVIDGDLTPHASNTYSLGSSSYKWNEMYVTYANIGSLYQANGTAGGSITSYSSIVPNSTNYNLGSTSKKWGTVYASTIGDGTTTYAVSNLLTTVGNTKIGGPLTPANNLDGNCKLGDNTHRWYYSYTTYMNTTNAVVSTSISGDAIFKDISSSITAKTGDSGKTFTADHYIHAYLILNKFVYIRLRVIPGTGGIATNTTVYLALIPTSYMCSNVTSGGIGTLIGLGRRLDTYTPIHCWINSSRQIRCRLDTDLAATKALEVEFFYELS